MTRSIGREVERHRERLGWKIAALSRKTEELAHPMSRMAISNLEAGRRESITVAEWLVLAAALDVPPVMLIAPAGFVEDIEPLPAHDQPVPTIEALYWLRGDSALDLADSALSTSDYQQPEVFAALRAYVRADQLAQELAQEYALMSRDQASMDMDLWAELIPKMRRQLQNARAAVRSRGLEPPPIGPGFGDVDAAPRPSDVDGSANFGKDPEA